MEDEDSIAALLDFEVWFVPRSSGGESGHAHASASHQEPSGQPEGDRGGQQPQQQSTEGAQPSQANEEASPSGRPTRGKQRGGRARGGTSRSAGRGPASKSGSDAADAEGEGEGPSKRARTESDPAANQGPTEPGTVVVSTSKFALCAHSKVLRPILAACKSQFKLEVSYDNHEHLEAVKLLVQLLHDLAVSPDLKKLDWDATPPAPSLVVRVCQWATYWDAPEAVELCLDHLSRCELEVLSAADIRSILDLPSAVTAVPQFAKAKERCAAWLLRSFSNVPAIIADNGLRARFCSELSFAAVTLWAAQDGLWVRSENEVAVLLSFWYEAQDSVSKEEEKELSGLVRVAQMSRSFRHFILPKLAWFDPPALLAAFNMAYDDGGAVSAMQSCSDEIPDAWVAPTRKFWVGSSSLTFAIPRSDLEGLLAGVAAEGRPEVKSTALPYYGFFFRLQLYLDREGTLGVYLRPCEQHPIPQPEAVYIDFSISLVKAESSSVPAMARESKWLVGGCGWGVEPAIDDKFKSIEDFSRFFGESLQIKIRFSAVK